MAQLEHIEAIEKRLWNAAGTLRANSIYASNEYFLPVMGLIFLRHAYSRYLGVKGEIEAHLPKRGGKSRELMKEDFSQKTAIFLSPEAQFDYLVALKDSDDRAKVIIGAMDSIETDYESLRGVLPKGEYQELDNAVLGQLLRTLDPEELKITSGDVFDRIYEYFLTQFADLKAHDNGEFFTPVSLVSLIANVLEPEQGTVLDVACGSAGMFVQSAHFVEWLKQNPADKLTFRGLEKNATTLRLAKMNLAVHGLEGDIQKAITYYEDPHELLGKADFVMANPPFNVDEVDADKVKRDPRLPFGLPGVNKSGKVSNGNYLWISYFYSYLNEKGRAGFVMSSQASSAGRDEAKVRQKLIETGDVDIMIAIRSNFFYTRAVPCELWFLNRAKPKEHKDKVLMIDARNIYRMAVVISEEQGEVDKFRKWKLDITPHRKLIKDGIDIPKSLLDKPKFKNMQRMELDDAFKEEEHLFRIAIVCAMWMTGFDVPSLSTLYLDKPLKAHTLMQAIARANRVHEGKNNGLIVDYCGILKNLRKALATFAGRADNGHGGEGSDGEQDPTRPEEELLADLREAIAFIRTFLSERRASLDDIIVKTGFARNAAIVTAKEAANENDETRKRFEVMCREVFKKFKACINIKGINEHRKEYDAINIVYKSLQEDREKADITEIIRQLHQIVDEAIETRTPEAADLWKPYDISQIDFDRLRKEFERSPAKRTTVQNLKQAIEERLQRLLGQNPMRSDFQHRYEEIVAEYNREKDRVTIERTFEALLKFVQGLGEEESRAIREGLHEETLALFDLLKKPDLKAADIKQIKQIASDLLKTLKAEKLKIDHWRDKESTRDAIRITIRDFLWSDRTGLPVDSYTEDEVKTKAEEVFRHVYRVYPTVPSPFYAAVT
jgi:type I restriction-modification system DNA methylase subunit